jgi:hypothetical protein
LPVVAATWKSNYKKKSQSKSLDLVAHREVSFQQTPLLPAGEVRVPAITESKPARWLRSTTSTAAATVAQRTIARASQEMRVGAWLSAETSAWEAMHWAAEAVDLAARENGGQGQRSASALERLQVAEDAIREARDFSGSYGSLNLEGIRRIARSHQTKVLANQSLEGITSMDAADRYLDEARTQLAPIAEASLEAVQAMDLLAEIYLGRADQKTFPSGTALCLRRAALQGQPKHASIASQLGMHLAAVGLLDEARWALEHSLSMEPNPRAAKTLASVMRRSGDADGATRLLASIPMSSQTNKITAPEIVQLSPGEFAAVSKPVMFGTSKEKPVMSLASARMNVTNTGSTQVGAQSQIAAPQAPSVPMFDASVMDEEIVEKPGVMRRMFNSVKKLW